jgi:tetratricopeptide (TPR) repeat protein
MQNELLRLEKEALDAMNAGRLREAVELFTKIVEQRPDFEHGLTWQSLAGCHENLGELEQAERCYLRGLQYGPEDVYILGGYASFLYLHGEPQKAFEAYLSLLKVEHRIGDSQGEEKTMLGLKELAKKLGLTEQELSERINTALRASA